MQQKTLFDAAKQMIDAGVSIVPLSGKVPTSKWAQYRKRLPTHSELSEWFRPPMERTTGFAVVCGTISGGLLSIDFDEPGYFEKFVETVGEEQLDGLLVQQTGSGKRHIFFRIDINDVRKQEILAYHPDEKEKDGRKVAIELRGEGVLATVPPSLHPKSGNPYQWLTPFDGTFPLISTERADKLLDAARSLCQAPYTKAEKERRSKREKKEQEGLARYTRHIERVGQNSVIDTFNQRHDIRTILANLGYTERGKRMVRPGGKSASVSILEDNNLSYHHSSNDELQPITEARGAVSPFDVLCVLVYGLDPTNEDDLREAVKRVAEELGFALPPRRFSQQGQGQTNEDFPKNPKAIKTLDELEAEIQAIPIDGTLRQQRDALTRLAPDVACHNPQDRKYLIERVKEHGVKVSLVAGFREAVKQKSDANERTPAQNEIADMAASKGEWRFDENTAHWYRYDGATWQKKTIGDAKHYVCSLYAANAPKGYSNGQANGAVDLFATHIRHSKWNDKDTLIPCKNGVLDTRTMELVGYKPEHNFTWQLPYEYQPDADCPTIKGWMLEAMEGNQGFVKALRAYLAAIVRGLVDLQKFVECVGPGGSGKSTYLRLATALIGGENVFSTTIKNIEKERFGLAGIVDKRLMIVSDAEQWHDGVDNLKCITGGDLLSIEQKHEKVTGQGYKPRTLVLMAGNQPLRSSDHTTGLLRRRITIPFNLQVAEEDRRDLEAEFAPELPGLLNWVLELSESEIKEALEVGANNALKQSKRETLIETNPVGLWAIENLVIDPEERTQIGAYNKDTLEEDATHQLYPSYRLWCEQNGQRHKCTASTFAGHLQTLLDGIGIDARRYKKKQSRENRSAHFLGIGIVQGEGDQRPGIDCPPPTTPSEKKCTPTKTLYNPLDNHVPPTLLLNTQEKTKEVEPSTDSEKNLNSLYKPTLSMGGYGEVGVKKELFKGHPKNDKGYEGGIPENNATNPASQIIEEDF